MDGQLQTSPAKKSCKCWSGWQEVRKTVRDDQGVFAFPNFSWMSAIALQTS